VDSPKGKTKFTIESVPWNTTFSGKILGVGSHLHDGGVRSVVTVNGKPICDAPASYGAPAAYKSPPVPSMPGLKSDVKALMDKDSEHISHLQVCYNAAEIKEGDTLAIQGHYDYTERMPMVNDEGEYSDVMAIAILLVLPTQPLDNAVKPSIFWNTKGSPGK
jgi:hypothetical protein